MDNYDFNILQPTEFECLTRDLLQKKENIFIESFTDGRDNGIDLRFSSSKNQKTIVQAKRYKDFSKLKSILKKEADKVVRLSPDRYIISTSVGLTPNNKDEIVNLFSSKGVSVISADILGRDELNNILSKHRDIEKKYYKLWLASSNVLETIIHKRIENYSEFELNNIREEISNYVMNPSFDEANMILGEHHYVIISGIPGIGKTSLARMLVYKYLANDYDEFIYMDSIDSAMTKLQNGKKQIFYYDDFLGSTMLEIKENHFENKLINFIKEIKRRSNAVLILTTREYILQDANLRCERIKLENIEIAKCTLNIEKYTEPIRAHILYNHICSADIPIAGVESLLQNKGYLNLIRHKNFNPRIIESYLKQKKWMIFPEKFYDGLLQSFDKPISVWDYAFLNLSEFSQKALVIMATMGGSVLLSDWERATRYFCENTRTPYSENTWINTIRILEDTFINIIKGTKTNYYATFHNPSIMDYIVGYTRVRPTLILNCIRHAVFIDQLFTIFKERQARNRFPDSFIPIEPVHYNVLHDSYKELLPLNEKGRLLVFKGSQEYKEDYSIIRAIIKIAQSQPSIISQFPDIIKDIINDNNLDEVACFYGDDLVSLIEVVGTKIFNISNYVLSIKSLQGLSSLFEFDSWWNIFHYEVEDYNSSDQETLISTLDYLTETSIKACSTCDEYNDLLSKIREVSDFIPYWNCVQYKNQIVETLSEFKEEPDLYEGLEYREIGYSREAVNNNNYDDMFASLLYK